MTLSVYVRNCNNNPADYYRIGQYIPLLNQAGIDVTVNESVSDSEYWCNINSYGKWWRKLFQALLLVRISLRRRKQILKDLDDRKDVIYIEREMIPRYFPIFLTSKLTKLTAETKVIWDFDDDIFESEEISEREQLILLENSDIVQGIGEYAGTLIPEKYRGKFVELPTTDDSSGKEKVSEFKSVRENTYDDEFSIVWVGTASNLSNLDLVINSLDKAAKEINASSDKEVILNIICNLPYVRETKYLKIKNIKWERNLAKEQIRKSHLGIMPLVDGKFQRGKGGFKLIQYLSEGLPVIASEVGFCREVVTNECGYLIDADGEWGNTLVNIATDKELWNRLSESAFERYLDKFDFDKYADVLIERINE